MFMVINIIRAIIYWTYTTIIMSGVYLIKVLLNLISYGMNENISIAMVTIEAGLMILYFTFLPMILDNKNKEYYLGYKISDWLIYKNFDTKWNDINVNWIINVVLIILEIILIQYRAYFLVFILFVIFMILISKKVINYTRFITDPNIYDKPIEEYFLNNVKYRKNELIDNIEKNCLEDAKCFNKTIDFLLKNLDNKGIKEMFQKIYYHVMYSNNLKNVYYIYELISSNIEYQATNHKTLDFIVEDYEWYNFIKININEANEDRLYYIFLRIYENNLCKYELKQYVHRRFLKTTQYAIDNSNLSEQTKEKWFSTILGRIRYNMKNLNLNKNSRDILSYIEIVDCCKDIIDTKNQKRLNQLYKIIDIMSNFKENSLQTILPIYVYLIYLTEYETDEYISKEEREYYKEVLNKINEYMNLNDTRIYNVLNTKDIIKIFEVVSGFYSNWERMKVLIVKNATVDAAYDILYKIFIIYSKMQYSDLINTIDEEELNIFRYCFDNDKFNDSTERAILEISSKMNIPITSDILNQYARNLVAYATNKYKNQSLISEEKYSEQLERINELQISFNNILKDREIFKNKEFKIKSTINFKHSEVIRKDMLKAKINYLLDDPDQIVIILEAKIYNILASNIKENVSYNFKGENLLKKLKDLSNNNYIYLISDDDNYGKDYMIGKEYLDVINKYNVIHTSIRNIRMILNKLELDFKKFYIKTVELTDEDVENEIKKYNISKDKYMFNNNNYGYSIEFNKEEIKEYVKKNFNKLELNYSVDFGDYSEIDGCILKYDIKG